MELLILMLHYRIVRPSVVGHLTTAQQTVAGFFATSLRWIRILHSYGAVAYCCPNGKVFALRSECEAYESRPPRAPL